MSVSGHTLTLTSNLLLTEDDALIKDVINGEFLCFELVLIGTVDTFDGGFLASSSYEKFWMTLGESVTYLVVHERTTIDLGLYLPHVRCLSIEKPGIFQDVLPVFSGKKAALEEISISENCIDYGFMEAEEAYFNVEFFRLLEPFRATLRDVRIDCWMPLQKDVVQKLCSDLTKIFQDQYEVRFDCNLLPDFSSLLIEKIHILLTYDITVTPLIARDLNYERCGPWKKDAEIEIFKRDSVERSCCAIYYHNCCTTKTFVEELKDITVRHSEKIANQRNHLRELDIYLWFSGYRYYQNLEGFIKSFPNLRKLSVTASFSLARYDICAEIIAKNSNKLEYLSIKCCHKPLTSVGLDYIRFNLRELNELHLNCSESLLVKETLFEDLPNLEVFSYGHSTLFRCFLKREPLPNEKQLNDLPPELLEQIFLYLTAEEQRICREVCEYWFNILASCPNVDHTLDLRNSHLSYARDPVKLCMNTNFKYNKIIFDGTTLTKDEDLTAFWEKIGLDVKIITIKDEHFINDAETTGLRVHHFLNLKELSIRFQLWFYHFFERNIPEWKAKLEQVESFSIRLTQTDPVFRNGSDTRIQFSMLNVTQLTVEYYLDKDIESFFQRLTFPKLQTLTILYGIWSGITNLRDLFEMLETKCDFTQIKTLFFGKCYLLDCDDFDLISKGCPNLEYLGLGFREHISLNSETMATQMFEKLPSCKETYFVKYWYPLPCPLLGPLQKDSMSFQKTNLGVEKSKKSCRIFDNLTNHIFLLDKNKPDLWIITAKF